MPFPLTFPSKTPKLIRKVFLILTRCLTSTTKEQVLNVPCLIKCGYVPMATFIHLKKKKALLALNVLCILLKRLKAGKCTITELSINVVTLGRENLTNLNMGAHFIKCLSRM